MRIAHDAKGCLAAAIFVSSAAEFGRVEPMATVATANECSKCVLVRKHKDAVITIDSTGLTARIAWQTCVSHRVDVARTHALTDPETCGRKNIPPCRHAL